MGDLFYGGPGGANLKKKTLAPPLIIQWLEPDGSFQIGPDGPKKSLAPLGRPRPDGLEIKLGPRGNTCRQL